ncbi:hypothetical protein [Aeromonas cavernicola]|uniref:MSHA biogenesis protein MshF n=1 Tax=Aeromonas cavernicola TaxID=1006623 RepID=A0A2H9U283_9GAMM|nr:hypothetical protein [Aeromonas cavernicola]PJG58162.1 hypothetical protein CUC53_14145 [Aeromonas cavernicola]
MSMQTEQEARWLGGYRQVIVVILLLIITVTLVQRYQRYTEEAQRLNLNLLGQQFAERVQRLHGLWLDELRPDTLHSGGQAWHFDARGWPIGLWPLGSSSDNCRRLWASLMGESGAQLSELLFLASPDGDGCEVGLHDNWLIYQFSDGRVSQREE